jgi:hypothetical protein
VELSVEAFQASEMLVSELAVIRRFVGVVGACLSPGVGRFADDADANTKTSTRRPEASAALRANIGTSFRRGGFGVTTAGGAWPDCPRAYAPV